MYILIHVPYTCPYTRCPCTFQCVCPYVCLYMSLPLPAYSVYILIHSVSLFHTFSTYPSTFSIHHSSCTKCMEYPSFIVYVLVWSIHHSLCTSLYTDTESILIHLVHDGYIHLVHDGYSLYTSLYHISLYVPLLPVPLQYRALHTLQYQSLHTLSAPCPPRKRLTYGKRDLHMALHMARDPWCGKRGLQTHSYLRNANLKASFAV